MLRIEIDFEKKGGYWLVNLNGTPVYKRPPVSKMHAVETTVAKATRGQTKFKLIIETAE